MNMHNTQGMKHFEWANRGQTLWRLGLTDTKLIKRFRKSGSTKITYADGKSFEFKTSKYRLLYNAQTKEIYLSVYESKDARFNQFYSYKYETGTGTIYSNGRTVGEVEVERIQEWVKN